MDVETIDWPSPPPPRRVPVPSGGCLGLLAGLAAACLATHVIFRGDGEAGGFFFCFMAPFLASAGIYIGTAAKDYGWARVRPVVWAALLGIALGLFCPVGWVVGGAAGGAFNGLRRRSWADTWRGALRGAVLGLAGWGAVWGYGLAVARLFFD